jgi:hypothetical protein
MCSFGLGVYPADGFGILSQHRAGQRLTSCGGRYRRNPRCGHAAMFDRRPASRVMEMDRAQSSKSPPLLFGICGVDLPNDKDGVAVLQVVDSGQPTARIQPVPVGSHRGESPRNDVRGPTRKSRLPINIERAGSGEAAQRSQRIPGARLGRHVRDTAVQTHGLRSVAVGRLRTS